MTIDTANTSIMGYVNGILDSSYGRIATPVIAAIGASMISGIVARSLKAFHKEAKRLEEAGEKLTTDNPSFRALLADFITVANRNAQLINEAAPQLQISSVNNAAVISRTLALPNLTDKQLEALGINWNVPPAPAVNQAVGITQGEQWAADIDLYSERGAAVLTNQVLAGQLLNQRPTTVAGNVDGVINGKDDTPSVSVAQAAVMLSTLQSQSYYRATAINSASNSNIIVKQIRISDLSGNPCLACIALHGEEMEVGQMVDDHYYGQCTAIQVVTGQEEAYEGIQTGEQWLQGLPQDRQLELMGPGKHEAWKNGQIAMQDFVDTRQDAVYGTMVIETTLKDALAGRNKPREWILTNS